MRNLAAIAALLALAVRAAPRGVPGQFDYYLLTLSWAPDFCANPNASRNSRECAPGRHVGFVVHGLWPQYEERGYPEDCAPARPVSSAIVTRMLAIMPDAGLIQHEWRQHGTCSGLSPAEYFGLIQRAFSSLKIPAQFLSLNREIETSPGQVEREFAAANPGFDPSAFRTSCRTGLLSEVRVCLTKDLRPQACTRTAGECREPSVSMEPPR